ncbi:MAG: ABC transporter ATP-binding protein [Saprospiraceae bacterium]|nr:ABC transporter ATP-binding protein [Saprospiraceae bacterium]
MSENSNTAPNAAKPAKKSFDRSLFLRILSLAKPYRVVFISAAIMAVVLAPLASLRPYLIQTMVDEHIFKYDVAGMTRLVSILIALLLLETGLMYVFNYITSWLGQSVIRDLRVKVFKHISSLNLSYFDKTPIGQSTTRTISDIETINAVFSDGLITILADLLTLIVVLSIMFWTSWKLTLVCMTVLPILIMGAQWFRKEVAKSFNIVRNKVSEMNAFLQEHISGMRIVQIFNAEDQEQARFKAINRSYVGANLKAIFAYAVFFPLVEIVSAAALGLMVWYGAKGVIENHITLGVLVAFPVYLNMLFRPVRMLADKFNVLQMGMVAAERVFKLMDDPTFVEKNGTKKADILRGNVEFKNVDFAYDGETFVLKNVSFKLKQGETLAIVGSTGSGKTTITSVLNRFYDIQGGAITIDGTDIREFDLASLRNHIAVVLQDVFLFNGSVIDNITLRDPSVSRQKVIDCAKMIGADEFIERLPNGYDYAVMERGATLSMGQRQLISFVRALVFDPNILILDEATSSIDPETEGIIQFAIEKLIAKRTSIIIAHRLSTIRHANNILVMDKGEAIEFGRHEELVAIENGRYRELYEMQFAAVASIADM